MGIMGGYFGGRTDMVINFMISCRLSLPVILVALAVVAIVGGSLMVDALESICRRRKKRNPADHGPGIYFSGKGDRSF